MARDPVAKAMQARAGNASVEVKADNRPKVERTLKGRGSYARSKAGLKADVRGGRYEPKAATVAFGSYRSLMVRSAAA